jgi:hypothetical protein
MDLYNALGVATDTEKENKEQKIIFLLRLFACIVPALCGGCTMPWHSYNMFREQRDCSVRMEVCLCCADVVVDLQGLERRSTDRHDSEHRGPAFVAYGTVIWNRGDDG